MTIGLFTFIQMYDRVLDTASHILARGADHARATGVSEAQMLDWRLIEDMQPLRFQLATVANFTRQWPARVAGLPAPGDFGVDLDVAGFQAAIVEAKHYLSALTPDHFEDRETALLTVEIGSGEMGAVMAPTLPAGRWLTGFATTNLYFHMSMAYAILRAKGVPIGKVDLFPSGLE